MSVSAASGTPVRIDVASRTGGYPVVIAPGASSQVSRMLHDGGRTGKRVLVSNVTVWRFHGEQFRDLFAGGANPAAGWRAVQEPAERRPRLRRVDSRARRSRQHGRGDRGRGAGRHRGLRRRDVSARDPGRARSDDPAGAGDIAIGGKVGVNHAAGKNLIGAFHPPAFVAVDPELLSTLPRREFRAGLYETIKYGVIADRPLFDAVRQSLSALFARDVLPLMRVIADSCRIKANVVGQDEHERGIRRTLNFGHTVGHALEAVTKYRRFRHGEAVAYGMLAAAEIGAARGAMPPGDRDALAALVRAMGPLPAIADLSAAQVLEAIGHDKKIVDGRLHFVLPRHIGTCEVVDDVTTQDIERALAALGLTR